MTDNSVFMRSKKIGARIAATRKANKMSQEQLAEQVAETVNVEAISQNTISDWERGKSIPPLDRIFALSQIFNCDCGYLLCDYDEKTHGENYISNETGLSKETVQSLCSLKKWGIGKELSSIIDLLIWDEGHTFKGKSSRSVLSYLRFFFKFNGPLKKQLCIDGSIIDSVGSGYIDSAVNLDADILENSVLFEMQATLKQLKRNLKGKL